MNPPAWLSLVDPARLRSRRLAAGEALFRQGDAAQAIFRVERGRVRLVRHLEAGGSVTLHVARPGETVAEAALWAVAYHCDAVADLPGAVTVIPKAELLRALEADPQAALALARGLAAQVRGLRAQVELRNIRSAPERLLGWLRLEATGRPPTLRLDRPWKQLAGELGLTHEALYRALAALQDNGRISRAGRTVVLCADRDPG